MRQEPKKSRAERRLARLTTVPVERDYASAANRLRAARDEALRKLNAEFREGVKALEAERVEKRKKVWTQYDEQREQLIRDTAAEERAA